jgi:hypothetical protein
MSKENAAPTLLPVTLVLTALFWVVTTTGGYQVFVKEVLGEAYDSQAEHLLHGDPGVDVDAIRPEAMIVNGKVRMYFGPFPALFRIPLNLIYPPGRGMWSRISGFFAGTIALFAFAGLVGESLRRSQLSPRVRNWVGHACVIGFGFGSPLLFLLGNPSIYNESIIWGLAWSIAALFFVWRSRNTQGGALTRSLLGFSFCAAGALLSRVTFGVPLLLIGPLLAFWFGREHRAQRLAALILPLGAGLGFHLLLSYAKFGTFTGVNFDFYINPVHREFAHRYGMFNLQRIPYGFADYFSFRFPALESALPFLKAGRHFYQYPSFYSLPFSETYLPLPWCSGWLLLGAIGGIVYLFRPNRSDLFDRAVAVALATQFLCILSYFALAQRYSADLYPFLIFCFVIFLRNARSALYHAAVVAMVAVSSVVNSLATASWIGSDGNLPKETRTFWNVIVGRTPPPGPETR